jgi:hypothetical protein
MGSSQPANRMATNTGAAAVTPKEFYEKAKDILPEFDYIERSTDDEIYGRVVGSNRVEFCITKKLDWGNVNTYPVIHTMPPTPELALTRPKAEITESNGSKVVIECCGVAYANDKFYYFWHDYFSRAPGAQFIAFPEENVKFLLPEGFKSLRSMQVKK